MSSASQKRWSRRYSSGNLSVRYTCHEKYSVHPHEYIAIEIITYLTNTSTLTSTFRECTLMLLLEVYYLDEQMVSYTQHLRQQH